ncbi:hypothetical protein HMPREF1549_00724 [Actinomyces johnsonii F0510]|uniref:Uncharacterized protein n=1 Tax=Actinomyces johnsonii F0510 TaxID=1227262 RepID=U1QGF1_9ACTO|nr:hypothetical protein HMPREF1549_00724 [Actinomyces johnsonii F0510]
MTAWCLPPRRSDEVEMFSNRTLKRSGNVSACHETGDNAP